jgi:hypothetical protein
VLRDRQLSFGREHESGLLALLQIGPRSLIYVAPFEGGHRLVELRPGHSEVAMLLPSQPTAMGSAPERNVYCAGGRDWVFSSDMGMMSAFGCIPRGVACSPEAVVATCHDGRVLDVDRAETTELSSQGVGRLVGAFGKCSLASASGERGLGVYIYASDSAERVTSLTMAEGASDPSEIVQRWMLVIHDWLVVDALDGVTLVSLRPWKIRCGA